MKLKREQCTFFQREVTFLGHVLSDTGIKAEPGKLAAVANWQAPTTRLQVQQFMGLVNYVRKFIPDLSRLAAPLYANMGANTTFAWTPECIQAFATIKHTLQDPPMLAYPNPEQPYELIADASCTGCGAILVQEGRPIAFCSAKFTPAETRYTTTEHEMLGVVEAFKEWRCYMEGCPAVIVHTDHISNTFSST